MPTICSAICSAMRKRDRTVGTSTNCSADCGSGTREREGHGEQEILGTSTTCSAIGRSRIRNVSIHVVHHLQLRSIENLHELADGTEIFHDVPLQTYLPASNLRQRYWPATLGEALPELGPSSTSRAAPPVLVAVLWFRGTPCEWCCTEARTIWIAICSWRQNERILRSRRTRAAPACSPCTGMSTTGLSTETGSRKKGRSTTG